MAPLRVPIVALDPELPLPAYAHPGDAGVDLSAREDDVIEAGESCDDGNQVGGDGCSADCSSEACYDDWQVGSACNGTNFGNGCTPEVTGCVHLCCTMLAQNSRYC